jgi:uncharacterized membrane protein
MSAACIFHRAHVSHRRLSDELREARRERRAGHPDDYLIAWTKWNHMRTVAALAAAASFTIALTR